MADAPLDIPVVLTVFNQPESTARVLEAIRLARPRKLLVIADAPRPGRPAEAQRVAQSLALIDRVDWPCEVVRNVANSNLGPRLRIGSGLDWVFQQVERAIVLEHDCLPHPSFFRFCSEMLERYKDDPRIMTIAGNSFQIGRALPESYGFSRYPLIWGWASWRRAWKLYQPDIQQWPALRDTDWLAKIFPDDTHAQSYWRGVFNALHAGQLNTWDYQITFSAWAAGAFHIHPRQNLVANIGFDSTSKEAHQIQSIPSIFYRLISNWPVGQMDFPLTHPTVIAPDDDADAYTQRLAFDMFNMYGLPTRLDDLRGKTAQRWTTSSTFTQNEYEIMNAKNALNSGMREIEPALHEQETVDQLLDAIKKSSAPAKDALPQLLAAMLYVRPHLIPNLPLDLSALPEWLVEDYLKYLHEPPAIFQHPHEAAQYADFLRRWTQSIVDHLRAEPQSALWQKAALAYTQSSNFICAYFSGENLVDLYRNRATVMEQTLRSLGHAIDFQFPPRTTDRRKIRVGILSAHFAPQTETYTTLPAYKHLSRDRYEIVLFATQQSGHRMERYCSGHSDNFITLPAELPAQVQTIRNADLDVIWIGTNVTALTNWITLLAMHRLARVQVTSTSSCVTSGMRNVDYYLSGTMCEPADAQSQYTEKLLLMEGPAHCMDFGSEAKPLATQQVTRQTLGLADDDIVFASGANFFKVIPEVQATWVKILSAVPKARLLLYPFNPNWSNVYPVQTFIERFKRALKDAGLTEDRLVVVPPAPSRADVLNRLRLADVYLDSFPFSGVNSMLDPLEVGLPAIVMDGNSFRSLMAPSLMRELNIPELIADDETAYINQAVHLANDANARKDFARRIREGMAKRPRFIDSEWYSSEVDRLLAPILSERKIT